MASIQRILFVLLLAADCRVGGPFAPAFDSSAGRARSRILPAEGESGPDAQIDFKSIYNIEEKYSQEEALKSGVRLTKAMRKVKVDHEQDIKRTNREIRRLLKRRAYTKLAFWCFEEYVRNGTLDAIIKGGEYEEAVDMAHVDYELINACLAKYGMECAGIDRVNDYGYRDWDRDDAESEWKVSCRIHADNDGDGGDD